MILESFWKAFDVLVELSNFKRHFDTIPINIGITQCPLTDVPECPDADRDVSKGTFNLMKYYDLPERLKSPFFMLIASLMASPLMSQEVPKATIETISRINTS